MAYPRVYLAIDNCFASKRWTEPEEWASLIASLGVRYIEASADTECDPLYQGREYLDRWIARVRKACGANGVTVCNLYSGHGTYSTLGLGHTDPEVRRRMLDHWVKPMIDTAASLGAGLGFFAHAFSDRVLKDPALYREYTDILTGHLAEAADHAQQAGCPSIGLEQMYSPHQVPWTIGGARELLQAVRARASRPMYLTVDTGHAGGQGEFLRQETGDTRRETGDGRTMDGRTMDGRTMDGRTGDGKRPYLYAEEADCDTYAWLRELGRWSPIVHLQQTDGKVSAHWPFTEARNAKGIIEGRKVLEALKASFEKEADPAIPAVDSVYLTIEVFASTASVNHLLIKDLRETVEYWRRFVPEDGLRLDQLVV